MNLTFHCQTFPTSTSELSARPVMTTEMLKGSYWVTWTVVFSTDSSTFIPALFLSKMFSSGWSCSEILLFIIGMRLNQNMRYITVKFCKIMFNICFKTKICRIHNAFQNFLKCNISNPISLFRLRTIFDIIKLSCQQQIWDIKIQQGAPVEIFQALVVIVI